MANKLTQPVYNPNTLKLDTTQPIVNPMQTNRDMTQPVTNPQNFNMGEALQNYQGTNIGGQYFTTSQIADPTMQDTIRQAVVGGGAINNDMGNNQWQSQSNGYNQVSQPQQPSLAQPKNTLMDMNAQLVEAQKANKLSGLTNAYNASNANLDRQDSKIEPQAYIDRAKTSTSSQLGAKSFAEYLANRGQTSSGFGNQSELNRNMQLQGDIGSIDLQARNARNDIAMNKTNLANALQNDIQGANAGIEADSLARQISLMQQEQQRNDQLDQFNKNYGLSLNQFDYGKSQDLISQTGKLADGTYTQQGQANATQQELQMAQLAEMQNPNSITNQMNQIGLNTAKLNYAALPQQIQAQAQQIVQQLRQGAIDMQTAQIKLDYLPKMMQADLAATNRSNQPSGNNGAPSSVPSALAAPKANGNGTVDNVNRTAADIDNIVKATGYNKEDRLASLNTMLEFYSAQGGTQSEYMINYINQGVRTIKGQKSL